MRRRLSFGGAMRANLVRGIDKLDKAVGCTLGPGGRIVLIEDQFGKVIATKDGVTVARATYLPDQREYLGCLLLQEAALKVADELGDGTTTCVVTGAALIREAQHLVGSGHHPIHLADEIRAAAKVAINTIMANSLPVAGDARWAALIAHVSGNADSRVTDIVARAFQWVGVNGVMTLRDGTGDAPRLTLHDGFKIPRGWPHALLAPESGTIQIGEPGAFVLICNRVLYSGADLIPCMQHAAERGCGLVIVCENIAGDAIETVIGNCRTEALRAIVVKPPGFHDRLFDFMHDLAMWCGATVQDLYTGMEGAIEPDLMGFVASVEQDAKTTTLIGGAAKPEMADRIRALETQRDTGNAYDRDKAVERLGRLRGRIAAIEAGATTASEATELKYRIEDALCAVRAAYRDGVQPGGGTALYRASWILPATAGGRALALAMRAPAVRILSNAGTDPMALVHAQQANGWGMGCDAYGLPCSMLSLPDPTAVVVGALRAAVSAATTLLTADAAVMLVEEE